MKLVLLLRWILIIPNFFAVSECISQLTPADSSLYHSSINNAIALYHHALAPEAELYNGIQYIPYDNTFKEGHPYFQSAKLSPGYIVYNNILYENIPLLYDLITGKVVINDPSKVYTIQLNSERISQFGVLDHIFIRLEGDSSGSAIIRTGFYDLLYNGKISLLKKQRKKIQERVTSIVEKFIEEDNNFYIKKDGKYFSVSKKKSVLNILEDKRKDINQYIRKNKITLHTNKDEALIKILTYYDEITK